MLQRCVKWVVGALVVVLLGPGALLWRRRPSLGRCALALWRGRRARPRREGHPDAAALVGHTTVVKHAMAPEAQGQVTLGGTVYLARNVGRHPLPVGITCRVTAIDHLTLWVDGDP